MKWLLWKDYRQNRLVVFVGLFLLVLPYAVVACAMGWDVFVRDRSVVTSRWYETFVIAGAYSLAISQLTVALIGGNAIAGERADRCSEFLYSLPFARRRLLASKLILALAVVVVIWFVNGVTICALIQVPLVQLFDHDKLVPFAAGFAVTGLTFFCIAWLLSSFGASPVLSVCGGLLTPILVSSSISIVDWLYFDSSLLRESRMSGFHFFLWYCSICVVFDVVCFSVGTWYYLRRVEP